MAKQALSEKTPTERIQEAQVIEAEAKAAAAKAQAAEATARAKEAEVRAAAAAAMADGTKEGKERTASAPLNKPGEW